MWTISELKNNAKETMKTCYWKAVLVALITSLGSLLVTTVVNKGNEKLVEINANLSTYVGLAIMLLVIYPLTIGCYKFFILAKEQGAGTDLKHIFLAFKENYGNVVVTMFMCRLFIALWSILFVIPGIIKSYQYRMVPYLLAEDPNMDRKEAFAKSKAMMKGEKLNAFWLDLSFLGWIILGGITGGILSVFYVSPYKAITNSELYLALKDKNVA